MRPCENEPAKSQELNLKPGMLCLMDTAYAAVHPASESESLHEGTPVIVRSIDYNLKMVVVEDYRGVPWSFTNEDCFPEVECFFHPLTRNETQMLLDVDFPRKSKIAQRFGYLSIAPIMVLLIIIGIIWHIITAQLSLFFIILYALIAISLAIPPMIAIIRTRNSRKWNISFAAHAFAKDYPRNSIALEVLLQRHPIYMQEV